MTSSEQIRDQQRETWNKFSVGWKKHDNLVFEWLRPVGDKLIENVELRAGYVVLDAATGTGEPGISAARKLGSGKVIGADVAANMLSIAEGKAKSMGILNYESRICNESSLPFPDGYFDAIMCRFGVMYFPQPETAVKELARVLKRSHKLALAAWAGPSKNTWATTATSVVNQALSLPPPAVDSPGLFRFSEPGTLTKLLTKAGLEHVAESEVKGELSFNSAESYWEFITDVVAPIAVALSKATPEQRDKIKNGVIESAKKNSDGNKLFFSWSAWVVNGTK